MGQITYVAYWLADGGVWTTGSDGEPVLITVTAGKWRTRDELCALADKAIAEWRANEEREAKVIEHMLDGLSSTPRGLAGRMTPDQLRRALAFGGDESFGPPNPSTTSSPDTTPAKGR